MEIARVFLDVNMGLGFQGLERIMNEAKIKKSTLSDKSFIVFVNRRATKFKLLVGSTYLVYFNNGDKRFPLEALSNLPLAFEGNKFNFNKAIERTIRQKLETKS